MVSPRTALALLLTLLLAPSASAQSDALTMAARAGDVAQVQRLLDQGTPVDTRFSGRHTALMAAAAYGEVAVVRLLLAYGADASLRDAEGRTAADRARANGHADVVAALAEPPGARPSRSSAASASGARSAEGYRVGEAVLIEWSGGWYPGRILEAAQARFKIRYDGYSDTWDEWVTTERLRRPGTPEPAAPDPAQVPPPTPAGVVSAGRYGCYFNNYPHGLWRSSIQYVELLGGARYREPRGAGAFTLDAATGAMRMTSGPLQGRVASYQLDANGRPTVVFPRRENEVDGRPTIDISSTYCYFGRD